MPGNYVLLETIQLTQSASSVTFDNIPQTGYSDLKVIISARCDAAFTRRILRLRFNNSSNASDYTARDIVGSGSAASSGSQTAGTSTYIQVYDLPAANATANIFGNIMIDVLNYANTSTYKSISVDSVAEDNTTTTYMSLLAGLYNQNTAISQINLSPDSGNFVANSTFSLYGIAAVGSTPTIAPKATGGNMVSTDGTYWYHTFLTSGTFTPQTALTCDYLVVAGGGGGGARHGGGGGGGGYRTSIGGSPTSVSINTAYSVIVGAGGVGGIKPSIGGTSGSDSIFSTITSTGGGRGSNDSSGPGALNGGSGGGGGSGASISLFGLGNTPSTSPSQGNNGGEGFTDCGGGGGGSSAVGAKSSISGKGGSGGNGTANSITGSSVTYAGGGGGGGENGGFGTGGTGGGGTGAYDSGAGSSGTANTGGGGGGGSNSTYNGYAGGSGIIIIRYAM